jgi:hypothetical protein
LEVVFGNRVEFGPIGVCWVREQGVGEGAVHCAVAVRTRKSGSQSHTLEGGSSALFGEAVLTKCCPWSLSQADGIHSRRDEREILKRLFDTFIDMGGS